MVVLAYMWWDRLNRKEHGGAGVHVVGLNCAGATVVFGWFAYARLCEPPKLRLGLCRAIRQTINIINKLFTRADPITRVITYQTGPYHGPRMELTPTYTYFSPTYTLFDAG